MNFKIKGMTRKVWLLMFVVMHSVLSFAQTTGSVSIKFIDSREGGVSNYNSFNDDDSLLLYKIENNFIVGRICDFSISDSIFMDNLDTGLYHFKYRNMFGESIDKIISVNVGHHSNIVIAADSLISYDNDILDDLSKGDSLTLYYKRSGCFEYDVKKISITKDSVFVARLYDCTFEYLPEGDKSIQNGLYIPGPLMKEVRMDNKQVAAFVRFENELNAIIYRNCTTVTLYKLIDSNGFILNREDGGCDWDGYAYLEEALFGLTEN